MVFCFAMEIKNLRVIFSTVLYVYFEWHHRIFFFSKIRGIQELKKKNVGLIFVGMQHQVPLIHLWIGGGMRGGPETPDWAFHSCSVLFKTTLKVPRRFGDIMGFL